MTSAMVLLAAAAQKSRTLTDGVGAWTCQGPAALGIRDNH